MKATLNYINFQRNGVQGTPFYHCKVDILDDIKRKMFVTFEATEDDKQINVSSCRALFVEDLSMKFRGDEIGYAINKEIQTMIIGNNSTIYDLCILANKEIKI